MNKIIMLFLVVGISLSACKNPTDVEKNYIKEIQPIDFDYPLEYNNSWEYQRISYDTTTNQIYDLDTLTLSITDSLVDGGIAKYKVNIHPFNSGFYIYQKEDGVYMSREYNATGNSVAKLLNNPITGGDKYEGSTRGVITSIGNYPNGLGSQFFAEHEVVNLDTLIVVPADNFN